MSESHSAETIMRSARGFMASRILLTAAELDLFTLLGSKPMTAEAVTAAKGTDSRGTTILLDALTALGFLVKENSRYRPEPAVGALLSADAPESVLPMVLHSATLWKTWSQLTGIVRGEVKPGMEETGALGKDNYKAFIGAMHVVGSRFAPDVVAAIDPQGVQALIDIGGGSGAYTQAFLRACPEMRATLFDLPRVIEIAQAHARRAGMLDRITMVAGDFYQDDLPAGHDIALLSAIIHQNSLDQNLSLYRKAYHALKPGGRIVVRDHVMSEDRTDPPDGALFAVNMLAGTTGGRTYAFQEISAGLVEAGFERVNLIQTRGMLSLVEGYRPD
ncbi:MAG: acetylserotonin O-methyltransferase [Deltaproteobacteria bacterium]|nr:acetylserotonin O-methyltransferase [Deltaproteobacteria bacterium]